MKSLIVVSLFGTAVLLGAPAGAQQMPSPYAPPQVQPQQLQQMPQAQQAPDSQEGLALPTGDETVVFPGAETQQGYDPSLQNYPNSENTADYPPADLGPDNEIAQSYDDGYDPQAYTEFQTALAPYGGWDYDSSFGYVWSPSVSIVGAGFSPYATCGHWALTEYGWTWVSDWSWGWAPFHYGRWITRAGRWSWVPGSMWGPAWVSWRSGGGYVGWTPLPPRGVRLAGGYGIRSPWRFAPAASLGNGRPTFISPHNLPGVFARTTVVSNDRLLTRGNWSVHVNAGPTRGITARPVSLSRVAPAALPHVAVYPHPGVSMNARPWTRTPELRGQAPSQGWRAGGPAPQPHTIGRAPGYSSSQAARAEVHAPSASWSQRPTPGYGSSGGYGHPYNNGWSPPATRPSYGAPTGYGAQNAYRPPVSSFRASAPTPAYRAPAPAPAFHAPAPAPTYHAPTPSFSQPPRSFAPPSSGGFSHFGSSGGGVSHVGASVGGHFGGFGGGGRRR